MNHYVPFPDPVYHLTGFYTILGIWSLAGFVIIVQYVRHVRRVQRWRNRPRRPPVKAPDNALARTGKVPERIS